MVCEKHSDDLVDVVIDEYGSAILTATSAGPIVVSDVVETFGMSPATAYRRINRLIDYDLLEERTGIDSAGNQYHVYEATFQSIKIEIVDGITFVHIVRDEGHEIVRVWEHSG